MKHWLHVLKDLDMQFAVRRWHSLETLSKMVRVDNRIIEKQIIPRKNIAERVKLRNKQCKSR